MIALAQVYTETGAYTNKLHAYTSTELKAVL